jgi:hypothetical protein
MSVRKNIPGHRLDGGHGPSGRTTVRQDFLKISRENLSYLRASSRRDGTSSAASNFLIRLSSVRTMGDERKEGYSSTCNFHICNTSVWTLIGTRPDGWSRIGNLLLWWTRVPTTTIRRPDGDIWNAILALRRRASGRDTTSSGRLIDLPFLGTWKEIWNWLSTERRPDVLLKRPNGCNLDRTFSI